ncbi:MAG TPA: chemotaxis protein CheW [Casimicrobiaceae bacterium]|nr:chemotaxis protein CheW [Casimicrobiaceae bacterium]
MAGHNDGTREARADTSADVPGKEYLAFTIGREEYGIDILTVQEIRGYDPVTRIAGAPGFIKGVINLRGEIVPIVDMRIKLGLDNVQYDAFTVVIVLNIHGRVVGMVVDGVSDVLTLRPDEVRSTPELGSAVDTKHIVGLGTIDGRMLILLDIANWMTSGEMALNDTAGAASEPAAIPA